MLPHGTSLVHTTVSSEILADFANKYSSCSLSRILLPIHFRRETDSAELSDIAEELLQLISSKMILSSSGKSPYISFAENKWRRVVPSISITDLRMQVMESIYLNIK
jgi:hypothetical protein